MNIEKCSLNEMKQNGDLGIQIYLVYIEVRPKKKNCLVLVTVLKNLG